MNHVARQLDAAPRRYAPAPRPVLSEIEIFASMDPLLGDLQRQYKDARYARRMQEKSFGSDDPMSEVARDAEDSAWCAMQTRYMEVRADRDTMRQMQIIQNEQQAEERREKELEKKRDALETYQRAQSLLLMKKREKTPVIYEWIMIIWLLNRTRMTHSLVPDFKRLAA